MIGVQETEGVGGGGEEGDLKDAWEERENGEFTQQCSVSPSRKSDALQSCKYGGNRECEVRGRLFGAALSLLPIPFPVEC